MLYIVFYIGVTRCMCVLIFILIGSEFERFSIVFGVPCFIKDPFLRLNSCFRFAVDFVVMKVLRMFQPQVFTV